MIKKLFFFLTKNIFLVNKEKQKRHLACMMAFGKDMPETPHGPAIRHKPKKGPLPPNSDDILEDCKFLI